MLHSPRYGDVYHPRQGALAQARHVFIAGNDLPARWQAHSAGPFVVLETGFGVGINFLAAAEAWRAAGAKGRLHYVATELHPLPRPALAQCLATLLTSTAASPVLATMVERLGALWPLPLAGVHRLDISNDIVLTLHIGDAADCLRAADLADGADALFLDGFAPQRNPAMWNAPLLTAVTRCTRPGATLATWCVAGEVRRRLAELGWTVSRAPGCGAKRDMLRGTLTHPRLPRRTLSRNAVAHNAAIDGCAPHGAVSPRLCFENDRQAVVVGAGIAGCALSERLTARGWNVTLVDRQPTPAGEASGNLAGIVLPRLARDDALAARLSRSAFLYAVRTFSGYGSDIWLPCGALQLAQDDADAEYQRACIARGEFPPAFATWLDHQACQHLPGDGLVPASHGGWWFALAGRAAPARLCTALLDQAGQRLTTHFGKAVRRLAHETPGWTATLADGTTLNAPHLVLANAADAHDLLAGDLRAHLPLDRIRGQTTHVDAASAPALANLRVAVCGDGYVTPAFNGQLCIGASFERGSTDLATTMREHRDNLTRLNALLPHSADSIDIERCAGRVGYRATTPNRLPYAGPLPDVTVAIKGDPGFGLMPRLPGLHLLCGLGSRGLMWAPLMAEVLASRMNNEPMPLPRRMVDALDPARYYLRAVRQRT